MVAELDFDVIPDAEPEQAAPRRRGRPPKDPNAPASTTPRKPRRPRGASLEAATAASLFKLNLYFAVACKFIPGLDASKDPLDGLEITAVAGGLAEQAKANPRFAKMLEAFNGVAGSDNILLIVIIIAGRRAARHGILPAVIDPLGAAALGDESVLKAMADPNTDVNAVPNGNDMSDLFAMFGGGQPVPDSVPGPEIPPEAAGNA